jgi:hypothetical protein
LAVWSEGASALGAHLAEMDRLLHDVQVGLVPGREPSPPLAPQLPLESQPQRPLEPQPPLESQPQPPPAPATGDEPARAAATAPPATDAPQLQAFSELSARLLASTRELLAGYERVLVPSARPHPPPPRRPARHRPDSADVTMAAGPFASLEALREFEQAVSRLPGVRDVAVRGYEGADRAIIEVRLDQSNP